MPLCRSHVQVLVLHSMLVREQKAYDTVSVEMVLRYLIGRKASISGGDVQRCLGLTPIKIVDLIHPTPSQIASPIVVIQYFFLFLMDAHLHIYNIG